MKKFIGLFGILIALLSFNAEAKSYNKELKCLTDMAYTEARGEGYKGVKAVTDVMFNRIKSKQFPNTICANFYKRNQYEGTKYVRHIDKNLIYLSIHEQVKSEYSKFKKGTWRDSTRGATFFNSNGKPATKRLKLTSRIGGHWFYRIYR